MSTFWGEKRGGGGGRETVREREKLRERMIGFRNMYFEAWHTLYLNADCLNRGTKFWTSWPEL